MAGFPSQVAGGLFVAAALMLWVGSVLLPRRPGAFFVPADFGAIRARYRAWIWLYRVHIFGHLSTIMAAVALATLVEGPAARVLAWPGLAVLGAGALVGALGAAFYYHVGAWGAVELAGQGAHAIDGFIGSLRVATHYATCLVRFGRVFFGVGQVVLAAGLLAGPLVPAGLAWAGAALGVAAVALTMAVPDQLERYRPIFHLDAAWMAALGAVLLRSGSGASG